MRRNLILVFSAFSLILFSSCSKMGALSADYFKVDPNPLEAMGGKVPATINGQFPEKYLKKNATVTVIPELRYANGLTAQGTAATFQGEKVRSEERRVGKECRSR